MWQVLLKLWEFLLRKLRSPLVLQVEKFYFQDVSSRPGDSIVVVTPHPRRYHAEVTITNRSADLVYVRSIVLRGCDGKVSKEEYLPDPLRLESHEFKKHGASFPLDDNEESTTASFEIEITPSVGRKSAKRVSL